MNKNISVWRGDNTPPTKNHIWVKPDGSVNINVNDEWYNKQELPAATATTLGGVKLGTNQLTGLAIGTSKLVPVTLDKAARMCFSVGSGLTGVEGLLLLKLGTSLKINANGLHVVFNNSQGLLMTGNGIGVALGSGLEFNSRGAVELVKANYFIASAAFLPLSLRSKDSASSGGEMGIGLDETVLKENPKGVLTLKEGIAPTKVTWDANSNMNDYTTAGIYDIEGTRESLNDILPITNLGENATISAKLFVTITPEGATTYRHSVGQTLILTNAEGKETKVYTRNGNRTSTDGGASYTITWSDWKCLLGMVESYINTDIVGITLTGGQTVGLNGMTENGMYSGIYTDDYTLQAPTFVETFVLVVINDYAVSSQAGTPRRISQLKYATDTLTGQCTVKKRVGTGSDSISWGDWEEIGTSESNLGVQSLENLIYTNNTDLKSGTYYGLLSDSENAPFILEVSTNFNDNTVPETEKRGIKKLTVATSGNNCAEYISIGEYFNSAFRYPYFRRINNLIIKNQCPSLSNNNCYTYIIIDGGKLGSLTIPTSNTSGKILYQYIINTAKSIANIYQVAINITPSSYGLLTGSTTSGGVIVEVVYTAGSSYTPVRYEKLLYSNIKGTVYKMQSITEFENITI